MSKTNAIPSFRPFAALPHVLYVSAMELGLTMPDHVQQLATRNNHVPLTTLLDKINASKNYIAMRANHYNHLNPSVITALRPVDANAMYQLQRVEELIHHILLGCEQQLLHQSTPQITWSCSQHKWQVTIN
jgi:hypothetical protein